MDFQEEKTWDVCCGSKISRHFIKYLVMATFGLTVIVWCMLMLTHDQKDDNQRTLYFSLMTSILFVFFPHPSPTNGPITKKEMQQEFSKHLSTTPTPSVQQLQQDGSQEHPEEDVQER
jgi:hypothetical protein